MGPEALVLQEELVFGIAVKLDLVEAELVGLKLEIGCEALDRVPLVADDVGVAVVVLVDLFVDGRQTLAGADDGS